MHTINEMLREARRELQMRRTFYPRLVASGKMTEGLMQHRVGLMESMVAHFEQMPEAKSEADQQPELFPLK
jgi:hypothetical protein